MFTLTITAQVQPGLHVEENMTVLFGGDTTGAGIKAFWLPSKAAFRAGNVGLTPLGGSSTLEKIWDPDSIGVFSFAAGLETKALGPRSVAIGNRTQANNFAAVALGNATQALGTESLALGRLTKAFGQNTTAMGFASEAFGTYSTAAGLQSIANGYASTVVGMYNDTIVAPEFSSPTDTTPLLIVGNGDDSSNRSNALVVQKNGNVGIGTNSPDALLHLAGPSPGLHVEENMTVLFGADTMGEGVKVFWLPSKGAFRTGGVGNILGGLSDETNWDNDSIGLFSFATGFGTKAKGRASTAMGNSTQANGIESTAMGFGAQANGSLSTAMGAGTQANGEESTAMGFKTQANGILSTAMGLETLANGYASVVIGMYNDTVDITQTVIRDTTRLFIIGNGSFGNPSNAMVVQKNGNVGVGTNSPASTLEVNGDIRIDRGDITSGLSRSLAIGGARNSAGNDFARIDFENLDSDNNNTPYVGARISSQNDPGTDDGDLRFYTNAGTLTQRMVIESEGNVGIGVIGPSENLVIGKDIGALVGTRITVAEDGGFSGVNLGETAMDRTFLLWDPSLDHFKIGTVENATVNDNTIVCKSGNVGIGTATINNPLQMASGAHVTVGGVWTDASSRAYKENIRDLTSSEAMATLQELRPKHFNYKVDQDEMYLGFIAEDVPDLVATNERCGLSPMDFVAVLTKVVQDQQAKIDELEKKVNALVRRKAKRERR